MRYSDEYLYRTMEFNEQEIVPIDEAVLETILGLVKKLLDFIERIFNGNNRKINDSKRKAGLLSKITGTNKKKCIISKTKGGNQSDIKIPFIDNSLYMAKAYADALASGDSNVMESTMTKFANNKLNYEYKENIESLFGNIFNIEGMRFRKNENGDLVLDIQKVTTELTPDDAKQVVSNRIPIINAISSWSKGRLDQLTAVRNSLDKGLKITNQNNMPGGFVDNIHKILGYLTGAINFITSNMQGVFNSISSELDGVFNTFLVTEKQECGIFNTVEIL